MSFFSNFSFSGKKEEKKETPTTSVRSSGGSSDDNDDASEPPLLINEFLAELVARERLSDCVFIVGKGKTRIPAHRQILAAASPIFEAMLYPNYDIPGEKGPVVVPVEITVTACEPPAFLGLLKAIYSDKVAVDSTNIQECIALAKKYQIEKLQQLCAEFMESDVNIENACELYELAPTLLDDKDFGLKFIEEHCEEIIGTDAFVKLSLPRLQSILESNELSVDEFQLYKAVLKWGSAEAKRRGVADDVEHIRDICSRLFSLIRFPTMALEEIAAQVAPGGYVTQDQLLELFRWVSVSDEKERANTPCSFPTAPRGGLSILKDSVIFKDKKWKKEVLRLFGIGVGVGLKSDKPKPKLTLLYRGSRDGFTASMFHSRCDGKGPALVVLRAVGQPNIFGAYTQEGFRAASGTYGTTRCWLYSMGGRSGKTIRLESSSTSNSIYHQSSYGPTFGSGHDLHVSSSMRTAANTCSPSSYRVVSTGFDPVTIDNTLLAGQSSWTVEDIEVFGVAGYTF